MHFFGKGAINLLGDDPISLFDYVAIAVLIGCMLWLCTKLDNTGPRTD